MASLFDPNSFAAQPSQSALSVRPFGSAAGTPLSSNKTGVSTNLLQAQLAAKGSVAQPTYKPKLTDQQQSLLDELYGFAQSGKYKDMYTAGESYGEPMGQYQFNQGEMDANNAIRDLMVGGTPELMQLAGEEYKSILSQDFYDPYNEKGTFAGFSQNVDKQVSDASSDLRRNLAVQGDLYSTRTIQEQGSIQEAGQLAKTNELGRLYDQYTDRRFQATGQAANLGQMEQQMELERINQYKAYEEQKRLLEDQKLKDQYAEWQRARSEIDDVIAKAQEITNMTLDYERIGGGSGSGSSGSYSGSSSSTGSGYSSDFEESWKRAAEYKASQGVYKPQFKSPGAFVYAPDAYQDAQRARATYTATVNKNKNRMLSNLAAKSDAWKLLQKIQAGTASSKDRQQYNNIMGINN